jgi:hypothetical protein
MMLLIIPEELFNPALYQLYNSFSSTIIDFLSNGPISREYHNLFCSPVSACYLSPTDDILEPVQGSTPRPVDAPARRLRIPKTTIENLQADFPSLSSRISFRSPSFILGYQAATVKKSRYEKEPQTPKPPW